LVGPPQAGSEPASYKKSSDINQYGQSSTAPKEDEFSSLQLQGGDTTRHIYRYAEKREREQAEVQDRQTGKVKRSQSVSLPKSDAEEEDIQNIQMPGGFRREHIRRTAGSPAPSSTHRRPQYGTIDRAQTEPARPNPQFVASNFIEFLTLYGHFAGETLDEDDEVLGPDEYFSSDAYDEAIDAEEGHSDDGWGEDSALLTPAKRKRRRKIREAGKGGPFGAGLLLLKSFVGTGVLFLPRAFYNGGMLFSFLVLVSLACVSYYCFILLVSTRLKVNASYGDMGRLIFGAYFQGLINFSLVLSQVGFASAYIVFVSENLQAFILAVTNCRTIVPVSHFIFAQTLVFLPISLYRNINNIQKMALVADLFIALGLIYLYYYDIKTIALRPGFADFTNFNPASWTLLIGTAIFTFEGVGLILPIQSGMRDPKQFPKVLAITTVIMGVIFISMGALSYAAYGSNTKTVVLLNMPQDDKLVNSVQFLYSLAILLSIPLQIFPAIEITSQQMFSKTGKYNPWIKWQKNCFRFFMVIFTACVAWVGAGDLDKFVSLVGSFACIPLVYIYPVSLTIRLWEVETNGLVASNALPHPRHAQLAEGSECPAGHLWVLHDDLYHRVDGHELGEGSERYHTWVL
jgi:proton-coupled amino acid transporter